jgi:hypothetical protein
MATFVYLLKQASDELLDAYALQEEHLVQQADLVLELAVLLVLAHDVLAQELPRRLLEDVLDRNEDGVKDEALDR